MYQFDPNAKRLKERNDAMDLFYTTTGYFTYFTPVSKEGEAAWREIAAHNEGNAKIYTAHLKQTLAALRAAGYSVRKRRKGSSKFTKADDELLAELMT